MLHPAIDHPANAGLRRWREPDLRPNVPPVARPEQVARPYESLGTHPDLVARLWDELQAMLPVDCRVIFYGRPALMHPTTNVVFGFAGGTHTYALRLPDEERAAAIGAGATRVTHYPAGQPSFDLSDVGEEWVFCGWFPAEEEWCLAAFEFAATAV